MSLSEDTKLPRFIIENKEEIITEFLEEKWKKFYEIILKIQKGGNNMRCEKCGTKIDLNNIKENQSISKVRDKTGKDFYFCSDECRDYFINKYNDKF